MTEKPALVEQSEDPTPASHFDVLILGPFSVFRDGMPVEVSGWQRKVQILFRILASSPGRRRSRDQLVELLWPETSSDAGYRNLRVVLHMLRRGLGGEPSAVLSDGGWIHLNPAHHWDIDLERLEEGLGRPDASIDVLERAAGYYRGEPLPDDRYDEWAIGVRARVQRIWRDLCLQLAARHREAGTSEAAVQWLGRAMENDPLDEEALHHLLVVLGEMDRRTEALRRYQHFAQRLKQDLDVSPSREMLALVASLRAANQMPEPPRATVQSSESARPVPVIPRSIPAIDGRLRGRQDELGRILWSLPPVHINGARAVFVEGEPGIGKTRLLAEVASRARNASVLTLAGAAYRHEGGIRYGAFRDALADYVEAQPDAVLQEHLGAFGADLTGILPELRLRFPELQAPVHQPGEDERLRLFFAVTQVLDAIARSTPLALLLDDLQWADEGTLQLLHFAIRHSTQNRMLLVGAFRPGDIPDSRDRMAELAHDLDDLGWAVSVHLQPLRCADLHDLVEEHLRGPIAEDILVGLADAGGNPLQALRTVESWQRAGEIERSGGILRLTDTVAPDRN